jgi:Icc-related predicted phosphoesterase
LSEHISPDDINILIHAGDFTSVGKEHDVSNFIDWFQNLRGFESKIFIAGNHDLSFQDNPRWLQHYINEENLTQSDCVYLEDSEFKINDVKFYGSPWQPWFMDWAFNLPRNGEELENVWAKIPEDTDILTTHRPPYGIMDETPMTKERVGCEKLLERLDVIKPKIHIFGHIHSARGVLERNGTVFVNASILDDYYKLKYDPIIINFDEQTKQIKIITI